MIGDELLDAQVQRAIMGEVAGAADPDECRAVAERIGGVDLDRWHDEWRAAADAALVDGEAALAGGHPDAARAAFLRASTSFRTAGVMLYGAPADGRLVAANRDQAHAFRRAVALLPQPPEIVELPYDDTTLPGYWFEPAGAAAPGPVIVLTGGYDGTAEELYSFTGAAALEHGYRVLCFDGPGQGAALLQQGLVLRPDWEHVIGQVLDWVIAQPGTDPDRIALVGLSLGGHLAPRAAGWALRRGQLVHGVGSPIDYLADLAPYTLAGRAGSITCPTFVNNAEDDDIGASAPELVAALTAPHEFVTFTRADGAADHCEVSNRRAYHARLFAWLDPLLHPTLPEEPAPGPAYPRLP